MNMNRKALRTTACCVATAITLASSSVYTYAATPVAGVAAITVATADTNETKEVTVNNTTVSGISLAMANCVIESEDAAQEAIQIAENEAEKVRAEYADIAIAQVNDYVNVRDAASEEGNVVGKLYNNSAATVEATENGWYKITSGDVTGYVKCEYVVTGDPELARSVSRRVGTVNTETLFVRTEPTTESDVLGMVPDQEQLTVTDESIDGWVKVSIEEGEGYVSSDYVVMSTEYVRAESKAAEEARLAKEEAERQAAEAAAAAKLGTTTKESKTSSTKSASGSGGSAVANYACQFIGNPYVYGGTSLTNGADCSGFVMSVYAAFGVSLPHSSSALRGVGYGVSYSEAQPGDIICYSGHVGIYVGNNTIVNASTAATGIKYTTATYRDILSVRRIF